MISWEWTFSFHLAGSGRPDLSRIGTRLGWFDWKLLKSCPTSSRWACSDLNSLFLKFSFWQISEYKKLKYSLKVDCIRSSLIECSFPNRKININPIYRVLMFFSHALCRYCARRGTFKSILCRILMAFVSGIKKQKKRILSVSCLNSDLQVLIHCWWQNVD